MRGWKRWTAGIALVGVIVSGWLWYEAATVRDGLAELAAWRDAQLAEWNATDFTRPAVPGRDEPGNAWEAYARALADAESLVDAADAVLPMLDVESWRSAFEALPATQREELRERWQAPLQVLREGTRCREVRPPVDWQRGYDIVHQLPAMRALVEAICLESLTAPSASLWSDGLVFATDAMRSPWLIIVLNGVAFVQEIAKTAMNDGALAELPRTELLALAAQLDALDPGEFLGLLWPIPDLTLYATEVLAVVGDPKPSPWSAARLRDQRDAYDGLVILRDFVADYDRSLAEPFSRRRQIQRQFDARIRETTSRIAMIGAPRLSECEVSIREAHAELRLLRMAIAWHLGAEIPQLADPLGEGPLGNEPGRDGSVRFFSAGTYADPKSLPIERRAAKKR